MEPGRLKQISRSTLTITMAVSLLLWALAAILIMKSNWCLDRLIFHLENQRIEMSSARGRFYVRVSMSLPETVSPFKSDINWSWSSYGSPSSFVQNMQRRLQEFGGNRRQFMGFRTARGPHRIGNTVWLRYAEGPMWPILVILAVLPICWLWRRRSWPREQRRIATRCLLLTVSSGVPLQTEDWIRLSVIVGLSLIYLLIFFTLGLLTSTLTHQPATALILVLSVWALWVLGVPRIGCSAAKGLRPVQPNFTFGLHKRAVKQGSVEDSRETLWKMDDEYIATVDAQMTMAENLSRFSPFASYVYASTTLAQTGITDAQNFRRQVADWDRERRRGRPDQLLLLPLRLEQSALGITNDLILLLSWNVLLLMGAHVAFLRYDVR